MARNFFQTFKLNIKCFMVSFVFSLFLYLFNFFNLNFLFCEDVLVKSLVNNIKIRHSFSISPFRLHRSVNFLQQYILNTPVNDYKFNFFKYLDNDGRNFPSKHVYNHYHLNILPANIYNLHFGFTFTHNPLKLNISPEEYELFSSKDLYNQNIKQYVLTDLKIFDMYRLKPQPIKFDVREFFLENNENCILQFKKIIKPIK